MDVRRPCAYCLQEVEAPAPRLCPRCAVPYHDDCWAANDRRCAVYACDPPPQKPVPPDRTVQIRAVAPEPAGSRMSGWAIFFTLWILFQVIRTLVSGPSRSPTTDAVPTPRLRPREVLEDVRRAETWEIEALFAHAKSAAEECHPFFRKVEALKDLPRDPVQKRDLLRETRETGYRLRAARDLYRRCFDSPRGDVARLRAAEILQGIRKLDTLENQLTSRP